MRSAALSSVGCVSYCPSHFKALGAKFGINKEIGVETPLFSCLFVKYAFILILTGFLYPTL